jgi:hypothetical protein
MKVKQKKKVAQKIEVKAFYYVEIGKANNIPEQGKRPCYIIKQDGDKFLVAPITSRMRDSHYLARIDSYIIAGFCNCRDAKWVDKSYIKEYKRLASDGEIKRIEEKIKLYTKI